MYISIKAFIRFKHREPGYWLYSTILSIHFELSRIIKMSIGIFLCFRDFEQERPTQVGLWAADQLFSHNLGRNLSKTEGKSVKIPIFL